MQPSYTRLSPRTASAANSLQTNPSRTNNQRYGSPYPESDPYSDRGPDDEDSDMAPADQRNSQKVNQVIQNFFTKAALTIISSRVILPPAYNNSGGIRQNKWFNVVLDDSDELQQQLADWKSMDAMAGQHPPLCIEVYLDMRALGHKQSLVIRDDEGKRWDVARALDNASSGRSVKATQVVLERWTINVSDKSSVHPTELNDPLPNVYKKAVVLFRALYTYIRFIPAFKYYKSISKQPANLPALRLAYRITNGDFKSPHVDTLSLPLYQSEEAVTDRQDFGPSHSPVGPLGISVQYRTNCEFSVEDSESLLSSEFMGLDNTYFDQPHRGAVPGSLPVNKMNTQETPDVGQAYGSLSTFHQVGPATGTSPISALRAVRDMPSSSPTESPPQKLPPNHRTAQGSKSSLRSGDVPQYQQRRTSVSFQPFKAGSLSSSPALGPAAFPSPGSSLGRPSSSFGRTITPNPLLQARNRTSLTALPQQALRTPSLPNETAIVSSASSSPRPAPIKYSSSFGHRRNRFSTSGGSKTEDDNLSSGKGSVASSLQRGSDVMNEGDGGSSGEVKSDDDNISDFLKLLEAKKELKSFNRNDNASKESAMRRTTAQLSKYQRLKDSHAALSDSVSSSTMLHRSSSSSSRQLSSVPAMIAGTSVSTASSPGKPISPHTPHTPAIPSRLSANSIIEYEPRPRRSRSSRPNREQETSEAQESNQGADASTNAIDIPTSPRHWERNYARRSSSVTQQDRTLPEDETDMYGRAASLPLTEAERAKDLTPSGLIAQAEAGNSTTQDDQGSEEIDPLDHGAQQPSSSSNMPAKRGTYSGSSRGRTSFFSHGSSSGATSSTERPNRYSFSSRGLAPEDDEPLLFQMSEIGAGGSRRSLEEAPGSSGSGAAGKRMSPWGR
ncbi:autophagy-related protein 13 [Boeremia exigua]|uniref:autophagy-related protein 13 n=1 Tax=Boeremia exigua TaxID=749465 RepID=UPI001E8D6DC0|nr:autophagy-related protein 13 [Boeremia exigua]KAH6633625.1 autophagy-related protein 13 [Boeremia exigua]